jgi:DNA-formamidopyrimidine glycosylase
MTMAEGHTVACWAGRLRPLVGQTLRNVELTSKYDDRLGEFIGSHIARVDTHGKWLIIHLSSGDVIFCHALMYGSWQFGKPGMELEKKQSQVRVRLVTDEHEAVFYNGPIVELMDEEQLQAHPNISALGPDILKEDFDREEAWRRLQEHPDRPIADAILDQNIVSGIGNIYKSEGLFVAGIDPRTHVSDLSREDVENVWDTIIPMIHKGVGDGGRIITVPEEMVDEDRGRWVYQRSSRPCLQCGEQIEMIRQGRHDRTTYFCPSCQD